MRKILIESIKHYRKLMIACIIVTMLVYGATQVMLTYYYHDIISNQDEARYNQCEISIAEPITVDMLSWVEPFCTENISDYEMAAYVVDEMDGMYVIAVKSGDEAKICKDAKALEAGEAIVMSYFLPIFEAKYSGYRCIETSSVMVCGCTPFFVGAVVSAKSAETMSVGTMILACTRPMTHSDKSKIKKAFEGRNIDCDISYMTEFKWLLENVGFYKATVILGLGIVIFALLSIGILVSYMIQKQKKEIIVFMLCGANIKHLQRFYIGEYMIMQVISLFLGCGDAFILVRFVGIFEFHTVYVLPFIFCIMISVFCGLMGVIMINRLLKKDINTHWRKLA
ncbi:MAG: hypothetical protein NC225_01115 [Clostridium sp.]|nr:hypothetical protein [Clostridium sp.]MCM1459304.1 hypothetical protein [Bacteroides sp.]